MQRSCPIPFSTIPGTVWDLLRYRRCQILRTEGLPTRNHHILPSQVQLRFSKVRNAARSVSLSDSPFWWAGISLRHNVWAMPHAIAANVIFIKYPAINSSTLFKLSLRARWDSAFAATSEPSLRTLRRQGEEINQIPVFQNAPATGSCIGNVHIHW